MNAQINAADASTNATQVDTLQTIADVRAQLAVWIAAAQPDGDLEPAASRLQLVMRSLHDEIGALLERPGVDKVLDSYLAINLMEIIDEALWNYQSRPDEVEMPGSDSLVTTARKADQALARMAAQLSEGVPA